MSRSSRRWITRIALLLVVALAAYVVPTLWFRPWQIDMFYTRVFAGFMLRHPMILTSMGLIENTPFAFHAGRLDDFSVAAQDREARWYRGELQTLRAYDRSGMNPSQRMSAEVMEYFLDDLVRQEAFRYHDYPLNQLRGFHSSLVDFMVTNHPMASARDARNYVKRLERFGTAVDQVLEGVVLREKRGIVPPRWVLEKVKAQLAEFAAPEPKENVLYTHFERTTGDSTKGLDAAERARLLGAVEAAVRDVVRPAWGRMASTVDRQITVATDDDGAWKLPEGDAYYDAMLRARTTTDLPADTIHALGRREVDRIHGQMRGLLARLGLRSGDAAADVKRLRDLPGNRFAGGEDEARDSILAGYRAILADAERRLPDYFDVIPEARLEVRRVPAFQEKGSAGAYYDAASFDGSRPGVFYANLRDPHETAKPDMRTLAYHEGVPGHHFQIAIAMEMKGGAFFRKVIPFTAYSEGWALYAERLALEEGFHPTAADSIGALQAELFRAVRLVVDTGIHRKRWTRQQAIDWMIANTGMDSSEVSTEIERYVVNPGQACAYKVGQIAILELRERAKSALGDRFDLKRFHNVVLTNGALPLTVLEKAVDDWIASERRGASAVKAG